MSQTKTRRVTKRQLGQFMTPPQLAADLVASLSLSPDLQVLEPSFGDGSFIIALIERFMPLHVGSTSERLTKVLNLNIFGVEIDEHLYQLCLTRIKDCWGYLPPTHNLLCADFFSYNPRHPFDLVVGNPPFGGTINPRFQDRLDRAYGMRNGAKIKKETYAFFVVKCLDYLRSRGRLLFICSNTFMTIPTMKGLRKLMMEYCSVTVDDLPVFSEETSYPMVLLNLTRTGQTDHVTISSHPVLRSTMELTGNFSWAITDDAAQYFKGSTLGDYVVCSSGMTIGNNDLFIRAIDRGRIIEHSAFEFFEERITVDAEVSRARNGLLSPKLLARARYQEQQGLTRRTVQVVVKNPPERIQLPHPEYRYYNKAVSAIIYSAPTHVIFWKDEGDAVLTFKRNGPWYLHGVGGQPYFGRSGLTWQLIASRLNVRYLPEGYILDSGAPCAFLRPGVDESELYFILGWTCTELCTRLLKSVINHTQNIQSKDFERLPYPFWMDSAEKGQAIAVVRSLIKKAMAGEGISRADPDVSALNRLYAYHQVEVAAFKKSRHQPEQIQLALF